MGTEDVKVTAMDMYKYKEKLRLYKGVPIFLVRPAKRESNAKTEMYLGVNSCHTCFLSKKQLTPSAF